MNKLKTSIVTLGASLAMVGGTVGLASAQSVSPAVQSGNVGTSGIPRSVFNQDEISAIQSVLNTSTANIKSARQDHQLAKLIQSAGLTKPTFLADVKAKLTSELENQGYTQQQITIALQHRVILSLRHKLADKNQ